jgi:hypothetical protein
MQQHPLLQTLFSKALFPVPSPTSLLHPSNKLHPEALNASPGISNSTTPQAHCQTCGSAKQEMSQRSSATSATTSPDPVTKHNSSLQPLSIITTPSQPPPSRASQLESASAHGRAHVPRRAQPYWERRVVLCWSVLLYHGPWKQCTGAL